MEAGLGPAHPIEGMDLARFGATPLAVLVCTARIRRPPTAKKRDQKGEDGAGEARHTLRLCAYTSGGSEPVAVRVDEVDS